jgi:hypothetical protein
MAITPEELKALIKIDFSIEKISTLSSDGKNLLLRVPKKVRDYLNLKKGDKLRWLIKKNNELGIEVVVNGQ